MADKKPKWELVKAFNTATGFKEWLEDKEVESKAKRQEFVDRLMNGEAIEYGKGSRMRYEFGDGVGVFTIERLQGM